MNDIIGLALRPVVSCSAPVSRPLASSANKSLQKYSPNRAQLPIILDFQADKGREEIKNWYRRQPTTHFQLIEWRKNVEGQFRHEFIVAHLDNSTICRFDRRAREDMRGHALKEKGTISEDSAHVITKADTKSILSLQVSEVLLSIYLPKGQDLRFVLAVCCGIQLHPKAKSYSLLHYNCYFFSWTLFVTIARRACGWEVDKTPNELWKCVVTECKPRICEWVTCTWRNPSNFSVSPSLASAIKRLGLALGINLRPGYVCSLDLPLVRGYSYESMKHEFAHGNYTPDIPRNILETVLFRSQLYPMLKQEIYSALLNGSKMGATRFVREELEFVKINAGASPSGRMDQVSYRKATSIYKSRGAPLREDPSSWTSSQRRAWQQAQEISKKSFDELIPSLNIYDIIVDALEKVLPESFASYGHGGSLENFIRERMVDHFGQVETYGFGKAEKLIERAEESMVEIWVCAVGMMKDQSGFFSPRNLPASSVSSRQYPKSSKSKSPVGDTTSRRNYRQHAL
ncbi:unnamed protein product [Rhizoctonia solani]|uniref:Uncharacterized protein n=1 Tax=Rhizoctonia solani TaxID=456999 RepID=A0A8H3H732_9AGAM